MANLKTEARRKKPCDMGANEHQGDKSLSQGKPKTPANRPRAGDRPATERPSQQEGRRGKAQEEPTLRTASSPLFPSTQCNALEICPSPFLYQSFIPLDDRAVLHCMAVPPSVCPFICRGVFGWLPLWGYDESCQKQSCAGFHADISLCFSRINTQGCDCWVIEELQA